ncbi:hypothetical protein RFI_19138, partial [Reticulomyxa filosa]
MDLPNNDSSDKKTKKQTNKQTKQIDESTHYYLFGSFVKKIRTIQYEFGEHVQTDRFFSSIFIICGVHIPAKLSYDVYMAAKKKTNKTSSQMKEREKHVCHLCIAFKFFLMM